MKFRLLGAGLAVMFAVQSAYAISDNETSHSFYSVRPMGQTGDPIRDALWRLPWTDARECGWGGSIEIAGFYSQSLKSKELAEFFMPYGKSCLYVQEFKVGVTDSLSTDPNSGLNSDLMVPQKDVEARHFNIETTSTTTTYTGQISFCPEQKVGGIVFGYRQILWRNCETDNPRLWMEIAFPVTHVSNRVNLNENVISDGGGAASSIIGLSNSPRVGNMTAAFAQPNMLYGKVDNSKCLQKWGVADVEFKLGWATLWGECCKLNGYVGFVAPTGTKINKANAAYMFNAVIGNNHHWGVLIGSYADIDVWSSCNDEHLVRLIYMIQSKILIKNQQVRSFDLVDKQWGRYMEMYSSEAAATAAFDAADANVGTFGINVLTQCLEVAPRYELTLTAGFQWFHCNWAAEVGYNFFSRHKEKVSLCNWQPGPALKAVDGLGETQQARTITKNFRGVNISLANYGFTTIAKGDLDLNSAAHPGVLSNIIYGTLGYRYDICDVPQMFSVGGSYEFTSMNAAINRWAVWGKWSLSF